MSSLYPVLELLHLHYCYGGSSILCIITWSKNSLKFEGEWFFYETQEDRNTNTDEAKIQIVVVEIKVVIVIFKAFLTL
jgi:hypothetical protein